MSELYSSSIIVPTIEAQPDFPKKDLTDHNAFVLGLMLQSTPVVREGHITTERVSTAYSMAHPTVLQLIDNLYGDPAKSAAVDHGVMLLEATALLVAADERQRDLALTNETVRLQLALRKKTASYVVDLINKLVSRMPRFNAVIAEVCERTDYSLTPLYTVAGAAMARELMVESAPEVEPEENQVTES